jgi:ABC-type microcin C transport system permease subunit YejB
VNIAIAATGVLIGGKLAPPIFGFGLPMVLLFGGFAFNNWFPLRYLGRAGFSGTAASAPVSSA